MAKDNKFLGDFTLTGIPPAPRGVPQIEVSFDIDANGILHVSAMDKGTNKEHKIQIKASGGLTEAEIKKMMDEAEENAERDAEKKELIELRNKAEATVYSTEKTLKDNADKVGDQLKLDVEEAIKKVKDALAGEDTVLLKNVFTELEDLSMKIGEAVYSQQNAAQNNASDGEEKVVDSEAKDE
jgi:molecular chaperone DnaK